jgi:hypothetical protein
MRNVVITSILQGARDYPLVPGARLEALGKFLGVPDRWDFGIEDEFTCQLGYADFEISLRTRANRVEIERVWVELWAAPQGEPQPKKSPICMAEGIEVDLGAFQPGTPLSSVKAILDELAVGYKELSQDNASEIVSKVVLDTNSELYFFRGEPEPRLMEIHLFADE